MCRNSEAQYWRERTGKVNTETRHWSRIWHLKCWDGATIEWTKDQRRSNIEDTLGLGISKSPWGDTRRNETMPVWSRRRCDCLPCWDANMLGDANWRVGRDQRTPGPYWAARSTTLVSCGNSEGILKRRVTGRQLTSASGLHTCMCTHACACAHRATHKEEEARKCSRQIDNHRKRGGAPCSKEQIQ